MLLGLFYILSIICTEVLSSAGKWELVQRRGKHLKSMNSVKNPLLFVLWQMENGLTGQPGALAHALG